MYIKGFRVKFASYRKFGSKWICGSVLNLFSSVIVIDYHILLLEYAIPPAAAAPPGKVQKDKIDYIVSR